jgi:hypothetical protein
LSRRLTLRSRSVESLDTVEDLDECKVCPIESNFKRVHFRSKTAAPETIARDSEYLLDPLINKDA